MVRKIREKIRKIKNVINRIEIILINFSYCLKLIYSFHHNHHNHKHKVNHHIHVIQVVTSCLQNRNFYIEFIKRRTLHNHLMLSLVVNITKNNLILRFLHF